MTLNELISSIKVRECDVAMETEEYAAFKNSGHSSRQSFTGPSVYTKVRCVDRASFDRLLAAFRAAVEQRRALLDLLDDYDVIDKRRRSQYDSGFDKELADILAGETKQKDGEG